MKLGLIAGGGDLPRVVAEHHHSIGNSVFVLGLKGFIDDWVQDFSHDVVGIAEIGKQFKALKKAGCDTVSFVGNVKRPDFAKLKPDLKGMSLLPKVIAVAAKGDDALLRYLVGVVEAEGFRVMGAQDLVADLRCPAGVMGTQTPTPSDLKDLAKAYSIAGAIGDLDIGQGAIVCDGLVLAVEAQEGTDLMLQRVATLPDNIKGVPSARKGVLVKRPKPMQEQRIDLPTAGVSTIENAAAAGLKGIGLKAEGALLIDRAAMIKAADDAGLFLVGLNDEGQLS